MKNKFKSVDRFQWNIYMFVLSYLLINLVRGVVFDSYINYLQEVAPQVAMSFSSYQGSATFISAFMLLLVNRIGFKYTLLFCPGAALLAIVSILSFPHRLVYQLMTIVLLVSVQLYIAILPPFLTTYTSPENRTHWYSRAYWLGYIGWSITTYLGGFSTVARFAKRLGTDFSTAQYMTKNLANLSPGDKSSYILANQDILKATALLALFALLPVLLMRQEREDYYVENSGQDKHLSLKNIKKGLGRDSYVFLLYIVMVNFSMGMFAPYFTVFLNRTLLIDRSTASLLVSASYMATVLFIMISPRIIERFGHITTLAGSVALSMPFMLVLANGDRFGPYMIPVVALSLFLRNGFANLGEPVECALPMETVQREYRTLMASIINIVNGLMSIFAGLFTGRVLFLNPQGYRLGFYIAFGIYAFTTSLMYFYFRRDYDRMNTRQE